MDFALFLVVTALALVRPSDFIPELEGVPLYLIAIIPCLILSWSKLAPQLTTAGLSARPVVVFGIGIVGVSLVSNLFHGRLLIGLDFAAELLKVLFFYILILAHVDSAPRLRFLLGFLVASIAVPILLAVLNYHGYIHIPAFVVVQTDGLERLCGTGIFGDPNDLCEIVSCAVIFCLFGLLERGGGITRLVWLAPILLFAHALALTHSRSGFLGLFVGLIVLVCTRIRGPKALLLAGTIAAFMLAVFGGRQTSLSVSESTGQTRIQLWDDGLQMVRESPLIGVGTGQFRETSGHVAHNSLIQASAELGLLGGAFLFGQYFFCLKNLVKLGSALVHIPDPEIRKIRPFLLAGLASFATSELLLTNAFGLTTYLMFGLATVGIRLADPRPPLSDLVVSFPMVARALVFTMLCLGALYIFVKYNVEYG